MPCKSCGSVNQSKFTAVYSAAPVAKRHFAFSKSEFGKTAIWADQEFWKYQNGRPVHIFQPGEMDVNLSIELFLVADPHLLQCIPHLELSIGSPLLQHD